MCSKWIPSFIDISFLLQGVEMCVFLILSVVMVTGLLGCCFLHPTKAAVLCVWWGCGEQPDPPAQDWEFLGMDFGHRKRDGNGVITLLPLSSMPT